MEIAQAELQLAIRHLKQVEDRVTIHREKIERLRARKESTATAEEELGSLLRALEVLKTHLANVIGPIKGD